MQTITNNDGDTVTRINVMQLFSYDVSQIVDYLIEENAAFNDGTVITLDMVMDRVQYLSGEDFGAYSDGLIYQDQDGNDL